MFCNKKDEVTMEKCFLKKYNAFIIDKYDYGNMAVLEV